MNSSKIWTITQTLLVSQLRASARGRSFSIIRRPRILIIADVVALAIGSLGAYLIGSVVAQASGRDFLFVFVQNGLATLPALMTGVIFLFGLVLELNVGSQFASSDAINWLPVTASEYVTASALAIFAYYSVVPVLLLSATMSLSYLFGLFPVWELAAVLSILGMLFAVGILEILKAILNRFSGSFYKRSGRAAIAVRAIAFVFIIVVFQLLFSPALFTRLIGPISPNFGPLWFVPFLWSSVSVSAFLDGEGLISAFFAALAAVLSLSFFYLAIITRSKYWVPMPSSVRISTSSYSPKSSSLLGFLNQAQLAIAKKDLRGLVRRKEMYRFLALPVVFFVISFINSANSFSGFQYFGFIVTIFSTLLVSISSIGSEGKAIMNLYQFPMGPQDFVVGKGATPIIFGSSVSIAFFAITDILSKTSLLVTAVLSVSAVALTFEIALIGLFFGMKFPNFSELRSSFISPLGGILGFIVSSTLMVISLSPIFYETFFQQVTSNLLIGLVASLAIVVVISFFFFRIVMGQARNLLAQIPT